MTDQIDKLVDDLRKGSGMNIGIIGSGNMGTALGTPWAHKGTTSASATRATRRSGLTGTVAECPCPRWHAGRVGQFWRRGAPGAIYGETRMPPFLGPLIL